VIVVHQDLVSIRNSMKLISLLVTDFEQPMDRISYILNKYSPDAIISAEDVEKALGIHCLGIVPADTGTIGGAREAGLPLMNKAPKAKATLAINEIGIRLSGLSDTGSDTDSWIHRILNKLRRP
jgi:Flp pilus assembly CpaE family ATPase